MGAELGVVQQSHLTGQAVLDVARELRGNAQHRIDLGTAQPGFGFGRVGNDCE